MNGWKLQPALCVDLDGTIRFNAEDPGGFINEPGDVAIFDDVEETLWQWKARGYLVFGITNQGGVAHGYKTVSDSNEDILATIKLFKRSPFDAVKAAYLMPGGSVFPFEHKTLLRKPATGLLAVLEHEWFEKGVVIDWFNSLVVGDAWSDKKLAENADIAFLWAKNFFNRETDGK